MADRPSHPSFPNIGKPSLPPKVDNSLPNPERPSIHPPKPGINPLTGEVVPNAPRPPEDIAAAQKVFDDSVVALAEATAGRSLTSIPLSDPYWGAANAHQAAYLALKDAYRELPISSPPDSDMMHDARVAIEAINRGEPRATGMSTILSGGITVPIENVPEEFKPFVRAEIPQGVKLVTAVEQPTEEAVIVIPIPTPPPEGEIPPARIVTE